MTTSTKYLKQAISLHRSGQSAQAEKLYQQILKSDLTNADAWHLLGLAQKEKKHFELAACLIKKAIALNPQEFLFHTNLGEIFRRNNRDEEAIEHLQKAIDLSPSAPQPHYNLGVVLFWSGKIEESIACFKTAICLDPGNADYKYNLSLATLLVGDWEKGWDLHESRWHRQGIKPRQFQQPLWDGTKATQKTILLHAEQGLGDTLQFIRYAPEVKKQVKRVILECQGRLIPFFKDILGIDELIEAGEILPNFDIQAPLLSLPGIFKTRPESIPADIPYFHIANSEINRWGKQLNNLNKYKVGINWQGNPKFPKDNLRSIPLNFFFPLSQIPNIQLIKLQVGEPCLQIHQLEERFEVLDFDEEIKAENRSIVDTAALIMNLDMVITSDTLIAHLAGSLGKPVWLALSYVPDWRWLRRTTETPWYPTMALYRQDQPGNWESVFARITEDLRNESEKTLINPPRTSDSVSQKKIFQNSISTLSNIFNKMKK